MWLVHFGTLFSAWFILAANSWMQHPVGYRYSEVNGRAQLVDFWAVMFNKVQLVTFPHVITAAYMTAGGSSSASPPGSVSKKHEQDVAAYHKGLRFGGWVMLVAGLPRRLHR